MKLKFIITVIVAVFLLVGSGQSFAQDSSQSASSASKISSDVYEALRSDQKATVFIMLNTTSFEQNRSMSLSATKSQVASMQNQVLGKLSDKIYQSQQTFAAVPAMVGTVYSKEALTILAKDPNVQKVDLNGGGGSGGLAQSIPLVGADHTQTLGITGDGVQVAVLDTGIDTNHPDFSAGSQNILFHEACFLDFDGSIDGNGRCPNGSDRQTGAGAAEDDHGHGTFVTGVVASDGSQASTGMAPDVDIAAIKVLDSNNVFNAASEIVAALDYINTTLPDVKVVNMSLGSSARFAGVCDDEAAWTQALATSAQQLRDRGTLVVAISGNNSDSAGIQAPGCISSVLTVSASTKQDTYATFGNSTAQVDVVAPGQAMTSSWVGGGTQANFQGTSFAAPHVAGCAALLVEYGITDVDDLAARLVDSNVQITNPANNLVYPRLDCELEQSPYPYPASTAWPIPGTIQAEDYDLGGPGVSYHDTTNGNNGNRYREDNVDISFSGDTGGGELVGWIANGEWLEYTTNVTPGTYNIELRVASGFSNPGSAVIKLGNQTLGTIDVTGTGGWRTWQTRTLTGANVTVSGNQVLRIEMTDGAGFNINWIKFVSTGTSQSPYGGTAWAIPGTVQAEDYDLGGQGVAYNDTSNGNTGGRYRSDDVDISFSGDTGGGELVGWIANGEWLEYTTNVTPGTYNVELRVASGAGNPGDAVIKLGNQTLGTIDVTGTGGWRTWQTKTLTAANVTVSGNQVLRIEMTNGGSFNINWIKFVSTSATPSTSSLQTDAFAQANDVTSNLTLERSLTP